MQGQSVLGAWETTGKVPGPHAGLFNSLHSQLLIGEMEMITRLTAK